MSGGVSSRLRSQRKQNSFCYMTICGCDPYQAEACWKKSDKYEGVLPMYSEYKYTLVELELPLHRERHYSRANREVYSLEVYFLKTYSLDFHCILI